MAHTGARALDVYRADFADPASLEKSLVIEFDAQVIDDLMVAVGEAWAQAEVADQAKRVQADLGWVIHPTSAAVDLPPKPCRRCSGSAFEQLRLRRVTAECFTANEPSWRLMERLGMRRETHTVRESLHRSGTWLDGFGYALLAEEWQTQEARS
jgi:RimJ/RimL family protein N-acetyltransferase